MQDKGNSRSNNISMNNEHFSDDHSQRSDDNNETPGENTGVTPPNREESGESESIATFYGETLATPMENPPEKQNGAQKKFREYIPHIVLFILSVFGLYIFLKLSDTAFPIVNINFKVNRAEAEKTAESYLEKMGFSVYGYENSTIFSLNDNTKEFLEKKLPQKEANKLMGKKIPVWYWKVRFFKYREKEEFEVLVEPAGKVVGFNHVISDDEPAGKMSMNEGEIKALMFLKEQGVDTLKLEKVDRLGNPLKNRTDRTYTFQEKDLNINEAKLYFRVEFQGDKPGSYSTYLHIPQKVLLEWKNEDKKGDLLVNIANFLIFLMLLGLVFYINTHGIRFRWKFAGVLTAALVVVVLLEQINSLALIKAGYSTNMDKGNFWSGVWISIIVMTVLYGVISFFTGSLGTALQEGDEEKERPILLLGGHRIPLNIFIGYAVAFIILGYDVLFYLLGKNIGVWTPLDISYDNILSTPLPWVNALFIGFSAAVLEELFFRMCSISFLLKWLSSIPFFKKFRLDYIIALTVPAVLWAALHCNYPQEPFYIRAVELTFVGIFLGLIYLKYGILSTIVSHYCLNAIYGSSLLIKSQNPYFVISGFITIGLMLIPAVVAFLMRDKLAWMEKEALEEEQQIKEFREARYREREAERESTELMKETSGEVSISYTTVEPAPEIPSFKLSFKMKVILAVLALTGILGVIFIKSPHLGNKEKFTKTSFEIKSIARQFLKDRGVDLSRSSIGAKVTEYPDSGESRYISRELGIKKASEHLKEYLPGYVWVVDVNFDGKNESYRLAVLPDGKVFTFFHRVTDEWGKSALSREQAKEAALKYLKQFPGDFEYTEYEEKSHENRTDYTFIFREKSGNVKDAVLNARILVQGDEPQWFSKSYEIPDSFTRKQEERGGKDTVSLIILAITALVFFIWTIVYSIKRKLEGRMDLTFGFRFSLVAAIASFIAAINSMGEMWVNIPFNEPFSRIITSWVINLILVPISTGLLALYLYTLLESLYRDLYPDKASLPARLKATAKIGIRNSETRWAVLCSYTLLLISAFPLLPMFFDDKKLTFISIYSLWAEYPEGTSFIPAIGILASSISYGIIFLGITALFVLFLKKVLDRDIFVYLTLTAIIAAVVMGTVRNGDTSLYVITGLLFVVKLVVLGFFQKHFFRNNIYAYLLLPIVGGIMHGTSLLMGAGNAYYMWNGIGLLIVLVIPLIIAFLPYNKKRGTEGGSVS